MFSIFRKTKQYNLQWLGTDMHSHILPGIDDGCAQLSDSRMCLEGLGTLGLHTFICTPHRFPDKYPNNKASILQSYNLLKQKLTEEPLSYPFKLAVAAEYMLDGELEPLLEPSEFMPLAQNIVLIEFPYLSEPYYAEDHIFKLIADGKQPVLAHPERYAYYFNNKQQINRLVSLGCQLQLNILSLAGYYGVASQKLASWLVREQMIDFLGTDLHHIRHLQALQAYVTTNDLEKYFSDNPIKNQELELKLSIPETNFAINL